MSGATSGPLSDLWPVEEPQALPYDPIQPRQVVILVGSAKPRGASTSELLGRGLMRALGEFGVETVIAHAHLLAADAQALDVLEGCDLLVLATPLYFDALPSHVVAALERIVRHRNAGAAAPMGFAAIVNCGTPDPRQADTALAMAALVARDGRMNWQGGLAFGEGDELARAHATEAAGGQIAGALQSAARALVRGEPIPPDATRLAATKVMPEGRYTLVRNAGWLLTLRRNRALLKLGDRPAEE